jgi:hypothetical protein
MPVVYMQQGMLGQLTQTKLPGACDTIQEAREKVQQLIHHKDSKLAREICDSQQQIYYLFTQEYALERWNREFIQGVLQSPLPSESLSGQICKQIGVLPLVDHRLIDQACQRISSLFKQPLHPRLGSLQNWHPNMDTAKLTPFSWNTITSEQLRYAQRLSGYAQGRMEPISLVPDDGICDFMDCDAWIIVGDRCSAPIATVKPYAFFFFQPVPGIPLSESVQRSTAQSIQNARCVLVQKTSDRDLLIKEYGISQDWIIAIDSEFDGENLWTIIQNIP